MTTGQAPAAPTFRFLVDTNVLIAVEPFDGAIEDGQGPAARLLQLVNKQRHQIFVHPANISDIHQDKNESRRNQRLAAVAKYQILQEGPVPDSLRSAAGNPEAGSNSERDLRLVGALHNYSVTHLVSQDARLVRLARRVGLSTLSVAEAVQLLEDLEPEAINPPPHVEHIESYLLDADQEIFESLRQDYPGFDEWLGKVRSESETRPCLVIRAPDESYAGIALLKFEPQCEYPLPPPVLKIATFKVSASHSGARYGELLLKSIFQIAASRAQASLYVQVFDKHESVVALIEDFGFELQEESTPRAREQVYAKILIPQNSTDDYSPLEYHKRFGPPALARPLVKSWLVPIIPQWHDQLFPDWPERERDDSPQLEIPGIPRQRSKPWGNALRKAYICNANTTSIREGDNLLFYRSKDRQAVTAVGVVEQTLRSADPNEVLALVGGRTVYSPSQIANLCDHPRGALVILFRQDRFIEPSLSLARCIDAGIVGGAPQTIGQSKEEGSQWLNDQLAESP